MSRKALPAWTVWLGDMQFTVRTTLEDKVEIDPAEDEGGTPIWDLLTDMTPDEAMNLAEALTLAAQATQERR